MIRLRLEWDETSLEYVFRRSRIRIGRSPMNDLTIPASGISAHHGTLRVRGRQLTFEDHDSLNGSVWVGEDGATQPIAGVREVAPGDVLRLGERVKMVLMDAPSGGRPEIHRRPLLATPEPGAFGVVCASALATLALEQAQAPDAASLLRGVSAVVESAFPCEVRATHLLELANDARPIRLVRAAAEDKAGLQAVDERSALGAAHRRELLAQLQRGGLVHHTTRSGQQRVWVAVAGEPEGSVGTQTAIALGVDVDAGAVRDPASWATLGASIAPLLIGLRRAWAAHQEVDNLRSENRYFRDRQRRHYLFKDLVTESASMSAVYDQLSALIDSDAPVYIEGEAGSGKELLVRALHHLGTRAEGLLVAHSCSELDEPLMDAFLFGAAPQDNRSPMVGALELARGGTVYLDEIEHLSPKLQRKLVRVLKEGEIRRRGESIARAVDVRLVLSGAVSLGDQAATGRLRKDLHVALRDHRIRVPPLRDRKADIVPLFDVFAQVFARRHNIAPLKLSDDAREALLAYGWPGNVRELQATVEAAVLRNLGRTLEAEDLGLHRARLADA